MIGPLLGDLTGEVTGPIVVVWADDVEALWCPDYFDVGEGEFS